MWGHRSCLSGDLSSSDWCLLHILQNDAKHARFKHYWKTTEKLEYSKKVQQSFVMNCLNVKFCLAHTHIHTDFSIPAVQFLCLFSTLMTCFGSETSSVSYWHKNTHGTKHYKDSSIAQKHVAEMPQRVLSNLENTRCRNMTKNPQ